MNERRDFLKTTAAAASVIALNFAPRAFAQSSPMYTNIIHTKENPGMWAQKAHIHLPEVTIDKKKLRWLPIIPCRTDILS